VFGSKSGVAFSATVAMFLAAHFGFCAYIFVHNFSAAQ